MPSSYRRRGFQHERDLARKLWDHGFAVMRAPASGSKAKHLKYPDLVAIMNGNVLAFEIKTVYREKTVYVPGHQVEKLQEFIRRAGGKAYIAVKIVGEGTWRFIPLEQLMKTSGGNYKVDKESMSKALKIRDLVSTIKGNLRIDDYTGKK